jgi:hypothetical protein
MYRILYVWTYYIYVVRCLPSLPIEALLIFLHGLLSWYRLQGGHFRSAWVRVEILQIPNGCSAGLATGLLFSHARTLLQTVRRHFQPVSHPDKKRSEIFSALRSRFLKWEIGRLKFVNWLRLANFLTFSWLLFWFVTVFSNIWNTFMVLNS